jgi:hypothetical protein
MSIKKSVLLALTAGVFAWGSQAHAASTMLRTTSDPLNELESGSGSALIFGSGTNTTFSLTAGYSRLFLENVQGTVVANLGVLSQTVGSLFNLGVRVGPTINYSLGGGGLKDAFYLRLLAGLAYGSNSTTGRTVSGFDFAYGVEIGKRFEIFPSVFWKPAFGMNGTTATGTNPIFSIIPIQFSFFF